MEDSVKIVNTRFCLTRARHRELLERTMSQDEKKQLVKDLPYEIHIQKGTISCLVAKRDKSVSK